MRLPNRFARTLLCSFVACGCALIVNASDDAIRPGASDRDAATQAKITRHAMPAQTDRGNSLRSTRTPGQTAPPGAAGDIPDSSPRYPGDLEYHGGAVLDSIQSHPIYVNTSATCPSIGCWGDPETFLHDLGRSNFIGVVDQYVGLHSGDRYTLGSHANATVSIGTTPLTDADILAIVHSVASTTGQSGYGHMYHVFLPPGVDECFDSTFTVCYSPDNFDTFFFCAYHGSADFPDIGHVVYSVEPFQNVVGCHVRVGTINGRLVDSTNNVLSHELIEAITDPDGDAWWNSLDNGLFGQEIGDECSFVTTGGFDPSTIRIGPKLYAIQPEYSNDHHACITHP